MSLSDKQLNLAHEYDYKGYTLAPQFNGNWFVTKGPHSITWAGTAKDCEFMIDAIDSLKNRILDLARAKLAKTGEL